MTVLRDLQDGDAVVARTSAHQANSLNFKTSVYLEQVIDRFRLAQDVGAAGYEEIVRLIDESLEAAVNTAHFLREARKMLTGHPHSEKERERILEMVCRQECAALGADPDEDVDGQPAWKLHLSKHERQFAVVEAGMPVGQAAARLDWDGVEEFGRGNHLMAVFNAFFAGAACAFCYRAAVSGQTGMAVVLGVAISANIVIAVVLNRKAS